MHCTLSLSCDLHRVRDIGVWFDVMQVMVFAAILTNCFILGFSSEQLMQWTPWLYSREAADGDQIMAMGSGRCVMFRSWAQHLASLKYVPHTLLEHTF